MSRRNFIEDVSVFTGDLYVKGTLYAEGEISNEPPSGGSSTTTVSNLVVNNNITTNTLTTTDATVTDDLIVEGDITANNGFTTVRTLIIRDHIDSPLFYSFTNWTYSGDGTEHVSPGALQFTALRVGRTVTVDINIVNWATITPAGGRDGRTVFWTANDLIPFRARPVRNMMFYAYFGRSSVIPPDRPIGIYSLILRPDGEMVIM